MRQLRAMRIGWVLLILNAGLAVLEAPYAAPALIGTAILAFVLTIRFIAARSEDRLRSAYSDGTTGPDTTHGTWLTDAVGWTALSAAHHHHNDANADANADESRKPQADSSESTGGFFSFFSDSGSSDSGGSGSDSGGSDSGSSDAGSSDSSSSGGSWD